MKWQSNVAGALASVLGTLFIAGSASADVRIVNDPGGEVSSYLRTFYEMRATGDRIVIDGPCLSACTLLTGIVPRDHVCVTRRAVLGFHAASYYNDVSRSLVPTSHHDAWPGSGGALPVLPLTAGSLISLRHRGGAGVARQIVRLRQVTE